MAIWVGKQKMSCRSCIKGHRSSTCNHIGGPLWAVRPAGRPNKACIHGPGDLCLCAHYFPLTWLKAAVPRNKKCSCQGPGSGTKKCSCGGANSAAASTPEDETQPIFYQELVARGLQVTTEPVDLDVAAPTPAPGSCCSGPQDSVPSIPVSIPAPAPAHSCCGGGAQTETLKPTPPATNGHVKNESISPAPYTPVQQFQPPPDFPVMKFSPGSHAGAGAGADHVCECGPTCNCVLCIDHPYNNATMNHIATEFGQMMANGPQFSPANGNGTNGNRPDLMAQGWAANDIFPPGYHDHSLVGNNQPQQSHSPPQQATDMDIILNPADFQMFNFAFPPVEDGAQFDAPPGMSMGAGLEPMPDLMDLTGLCGGAPEGCPCGDDCACIGCQIHKPTNSRLGSGVGPPNWV